MIAVSGDAVAVLGFVALFALMLLRVPVGMAMGLVGVSGFAYLVNGDAALKIIGHTSMRTVTDYTFGVIPMFLLMGAFVSNSGMSRELFRATNSFVGHFRGGLGIATIAACAGSPRSPVPPLPRPPHSRPSLIRRCGVTTIRNRSRPG